MLICLIIFVLVYQTNYLDHVCKEIYQIVQVKEILVLAFGYSLQAISETTNGLAKCVVNKDKLAADLNEKWEVLAEPIQTMLRKYGISDAYDQLKELTRGKNISQEANYGICEGVRCFIR